MLALVLLLGLFWAAEGPSTIEGIVLRAHPIHTTAAAPMTRMLLSTTDGLCAVRIPGDAEEWNSYADSEVEIRGEMHGDEFLVKEESDITLLKYNSTDPDVLDDILPAGELVRRRLERRNLRIALTGVAAIVGIVIVLGWLAVRNRRKARFFMGRVAKERRRTGLLHEDLEQQLEGVRIVLENTIAFTPGTPEEVGKSVRMASKILADARDKVHRTAAAGRPLEEKGRYS